MTTERICASCDFWKGDVLSRIWDGSEGCDKFPRHLLEIQIDCGTWCQGGSPGAIDFEATFGCLEWKELGSEITDPSHS